MRDVIYYLSNYLRIFTLIAKYGPQTDGTSIDQGRGHRQHAEGDRVDEHIRKEYLEGRPEEERDWRTSEQREAERIREAMRSLDPLIHEAVSSIRIVDRGPGRPPTLTLEQKVKLLLIKQLVGKSKGEFAYMLEIFSMLSGIDVSYKTVERLYSDELVMMA
ncbi:MAG: hypothetical protein ACP5GG_06165, partial [Conexivisphaera sp.]